MAADLANHTRERDSRLSRALDIVVALAMLIFLLPVMVLVAASIAITSPGPIIFKQERMGMNGRTFGCLKFRTMRCDAEQALSALLAARPELRYEWASTQKLAQDPRITGVGSFLRHSSIDELPQLINVLRGEMSLVGPRPIVANEVPRYGRYITSYFSVRPGLTGLWQVTGRNESSYRRRVAADVLYSRSKSLMFDLKILLMTIPAVLSGKGSC
ncbi:sugar transferase [Altererythrobacter arenosus]|uniref:Sugar transferase n=1 Tax=Altererythrobacter arenosus TaxID=3032592 RepID=A0ABY8FM79_9SPHN|nr:sugar transferase [Altererythrobacter sp. CAU 1644]WFL75962.1 sugar transferase [Altererythrobacter sp. CAU 1644]